MISSKPKIKITDVDRALPPTTVEDETIAEDVEEMAEMEGGTITDHAHHHHAIMEGGRMTDIVQDPDLLDMAEKTEIETMDHIARQNMTTCHYLGGNREKCRKCKSLHWKGLNATSCRGLRMRLRREESESMSLPSLHD